MPKTVNYQSLPESKSGRLTVSEVIRGGKDTKLLCICECGESATVTLSNFRRGNTKSCGCWKREFGVIRGKSNVRHGMTGTKEFATWQSIKRRCYNKNHKDFKWYGARGITVCDRWLESFENFFADMGVSPDGMSIDRIDNDKGYFPENCKWSSNSQQNRNRRPSIEWKNYVGKSSLGVSFDKRTKRWASSIGVNGARIFLGRFDTKEAAISARQRANVDYGLVRPQTMGGS
jgi:hypothetical protein